MAGAGGHEHLDLSAKIDREQQPRAGLGYERLVAGLRADLRAAREKRTDAEWAGCFQSQRERGQFTRSRGNGREHWPARWFGGLAQSQSNAYVSWFPAMAGDGLLGDVVIRQHPLPQLCVIMTH